jgi:acetylglutamate kinase
LVEELRFLADLGLFALLAVDFADPPAPGLERLERRLRNVELVPCRHDAVESNLIEQLRAELRAERIPIVTPSSLAPHWEGAEHRLLQLGALARQLDTRKLAVLRRRGGIRAPTELEIAPGHWLQSSGGSISVINLRSDAELLLSTRRLNREDTRLLSEVRTLLDDLGSSKLLVSVASPLNLLRELFTVKGAGTLIKPGTPVERHPSYEGVDLNRLRALIESSFGKPLQPGFFSRSPLALYLESGYRGAAILHGNPSAPFLSKFAVEPEAQGEGIGQDLWEAIAREHNALFWRARPDNPIGSWYARICDGMLRIPQWQVFWRGVSPDAIPQLIQEVGQMPVDFSE